jgi:LysR family hydrogen peroxide-inducible transcriptional activator
MIPLPTLRQLQYLRALHQHGHFGRAAEACLVTQSTLSAGLAELEDLLGVQLVERTKRRVLFTPLGEDVARRAGDLLRDAESIVALARAAAEPLSGPLRFGVIPTVAPFLLPHLVLPCKQRFPLLQLYLQEVQTAPLIAQLLEGNLDLGLLALPYPAPGIRTQAIGRDPFYLACREDHPLAKRSEVTIGDLPLQELLLLEEGHCLRDHVLNVCRLAEGPRREAVRGTSLSTVVQMTAAGLGITLVPRLAVQAGIAAGLGLVTRPLEDAGTGRELAVAWRASSPRSSEFAIFAKAIADIADLNS